MNARDFSLQIRPRGGAIAVRLSTSACEQNVPDIFEQPVDRMLQLCKDLLRSRATQQRRVLRQFRFVGRMGCQ
jgi:hypothetical protein